LAYDKKLNFLTDSKITISDDQRDAGNKTLIDISIAVA